MKLSMMEKLSLHRSRVKKTMLLLLCLLLFTGGCTKKHPRYDARSTAFSAELIYRNGETMLCATAQVDAPRADGILRDVSLCFSYPDALQGLILTRENGKVLYEYDGIFLPSEGTELLRCVDLLLQEDSGYEIQFSSQTGIPEEIRSSEEILQIKNFQKKSSR